MKFSTREQLLNEADQELRKIIDSIRGNIILNEDIQYSELDRRIQRLYTLAKRVNQMKKTNEDSKANNPQSSDSWRNKPVKSKYALKNLPPTTDPDEMKKREKMKKWEEVNQKLVDSWSDYIAASDASGLFANIVVKHGSGFKDDEIYDEATLKPIPSQKYPGKNMEFAEWRELWENEQRRNRTRTGNFIKNLLDGLAWSMMP